MKLKSYKQVLTVIRKEVNKKFTQEQQEYIGWYTDIERETEHICRGELEGKEFTIHINKVNGKVTWK